MTIVNRFTYRLLVNRKQHTLTVCKLGPLGYKVIATYPIAVGTIGHETPQSKYKVISKVQNPSWYMPNTEWVPKDQRGKVIPGGAPENPIKAAFLQLTHDPTGNIGIHGTAALDSLGSDASHGCIRVAPEVALHLFRTIPKNTQVRII